MTKEEVIQIVSEQLDSMNNMVASFHTHNGWDTPQLDPKVSLTGFPILQVATASVAPTYIPASPGTFIFQVDTSPTYYLWAYLTYNSAGTITGAWKKVQLT